MDNPIIIEKSLCSEATCVCQFECCFLLSVSLCGISFGLSACLSVVCLSVCPVVLLLLLGSMRRQTVTSLSMIPRSAVVSRVPPRTKSSTVPQTGISSRLYGFSSARVEHASSGARHVVCRTATGITETVSQIHEPRSHPRLNSPLSNLEPCCGVGGWSRRV